MSEGRLLRRDNKPIPRAFVDEVEVELGRRASASETGQLWGLAQRDDPTGAERYLRADEYERKVEERVRQRKVDREADRVLAVESAAGLFGGFTGRSLREAFAEPRVEVPWVFEGLQRAGHKATLTAQYKAGKTTLAANAVASLADGHPFLGRYQPMQLDGQVIVLDYELTEADALDMYRAMGIRHDDRVHVESLRGLGFSLANEVHFQQAVEMIRQHEGQYLVIDPFGRAMRGHGEENSNDHVRSFLMDVDRLVEHTGLAGVLLPVHTGRATAEVGQERARGATVIDDDADVRWILTRDADRRFFRAEGRHGINVEEVSLDFDPATSRLEAIAGSRRDHAAERLLKPTYHFIDQNPGAITNEIKKGVLGKDGDVGAALKKLVAEGNVRKTINGVRHEYTAVRDPSIVTLSFDEAQGPTEAHQGPAS